MFIGSMPLNIRYDAQTTEEVLHFYVFLVSFKKYLKGIVHTQMHISSRSLRSFYNGHICSPSPKERSLNFPYTLLPLSPLVCFSPHGFITGFLSSESAVRLLPSVFLR
uniref:Uncharacterized protein n=1 Tax=Sphaerodactylus townsendi TaxID=933632 RepID=A0ACB8F2P6_9SAUR